MRILGALGLLTLGCAGTANTIVPGHEGAPDARSFLVCAPNTVVALPAELQDGSKPLREQIEAYLRFHGRDAEHVDLFEARSTWGQAMERAKAEGAIERTPEHFAAMLAETHEFDALLMPSILLHETRVSRNDAEWDGVRRRVRLRNAPRPGRGRNKNLSVETLIAGGVSGAIPVTSLHVLVYTRGGERVFEGRGGIEILFDADLSGLVETFRFELVPRNDLFEISALREAIMVAFDPYLEMPVE